MSGSETQPSVVPKRPRYEWPWNTRPRSKTKISGQSIVKSETGFTNPKTSKDKEQTRSIERALPNSVILILFCLNVLIPFASTNSLSSKITIASHNLHGFSGRAQYHKSCLMSHGGIWMGQEHWLSDHNLTQLKQLNVQYVARSGMEEALSAGVMRGRPFGGVCIAWSPNINHIITPLTNYKHKRVIAVELKTDKNRFILICCYMPFFNSSKRNECIQETVDAISMIELLMEDHPNHQIIIGGDLNSELKGDSPFDVFWKETMTKNRLASCDNFFSAPHYTYFHESLGQKKFNDHFLVSQTIIDDNAVTDHRILDEGDNTSDHLPILMKLSTQYETGIPVKESCPSAALKWEKIPHVQRTAYTSQLASLIDTCELPASLLQCPSTCKCENKECHDAIQREYDLLVRCMLHASESLPRYRRGVEKEWWTKELTDLRDQSIAIQNLWIDEGRPRQGFTHLERLRVRAEYKRAIRNAKRAPKIEAWNRLHSSLCAKDTDSFWKQWRSIYSKKDSSFAPIVDNCSTKEGIAEVFKNAFEKNARPNNSKKVDDLNHRFAQSYADYNRLHDENCDCGSFNISLSQVIDATCGMKNGKCADDDGIQAEHFMYAPLNLLYRVTFILNSMLRHAFVPKQFRLGSIIPIIKDRQGKTNDSGNYRGITISPILSKLFEHVLKDVFADSLHTSSYQFGFKSKNSTTHALFCLKQTTNYYINHGSRVYCTFLDASKAFDRLVHSGLFIKLMDRNTPMVFLRIIVSWYNGLLCRVKWDGQYSQWFCVTAGVRQGGVLSPDFYNIYVDRLISILKSSGVGCYLLNVFAAALFYADDMAILSPSIKGLQHLLDLCGSYCQEWDICLNTKKSKNMYFGKKAEINFRLTLNGTAVEWTQEWNYLGVTLRQGKFFDCAVKNTVKKFYRALNAILRVEGRSDEMILLQLLESHCVPILTYAIETIHVSNRDEKRSLRVAYNSIFRRLFGYRQFESVTILQHAMGRQTWEELVDKKQLNFRMKMQFFAPDTLVSAVARLHPT